jgi:hypothetical protein
MSVNSDDASENSESSTNGTVEPQLEAATISDEQRKKLANLPQPGQTIDLGKLFKFEGGSKNIANALMIIVGGEETDKYAMFERTTFPDKYTADLFSDAAQFAEHGAGGDNLDFPIPQLGEWIVKKMRAYVSINGDSRDAFERAASAWTIKLWQRDAEKTGKTNPLLVGG